MPLCVYGPQRFGSAVDIVNVVLLTTYCLAGVSVLSFPRRAPKLYQQVSFIRARWAQIMLGVLCILTIAPATSDPDLGGPVGKRRDVGGPGVAANSVVADGHGSGLDSIRRDVVAQAAAGLGPAGDIREPSRRDRPTGW